MRIRPTLIAATLLLAAATACSSTTPPTTAESTGPSSTIGNMPATAAALIGPTWVLDGTFTVGGLRPLPTTGTATSSPPPGTPLSLTPSLVFAADGSVEVNTSCNAGSGKVVVYPDDPSTIRIEAGVLTAAICTEEHGQSVDELMVSVLDHPVTWSVNGHELSLIPTTMSDSGLHFAAATS